MDRAVIEAKLAVLRATYADVQAQGHAVSGAIQILEEVLREWAPERPALVAPPQPVEAAS